MDEMKKNLDENAITKAKTTWEYYIPRIIKQATTEKGMQKKVQEFILTDEDCKIRSPTYIH